MRKEIGRIVVSAVFSSKEEQREEKQQRTGELLEFKAE